MYGHPIRKSITLIFVYSVLIIGIFWLQFRSDSIINRILGDLIVSLDQNVTPEGETSLKNRLKVTFKGISFSADDAHPLMMKTVDKNAKTEEVVPLSLQSWEEKDNGFVFNYENNVSLNFVVSPENGNADENESRLSVVAKMPENSSLSLGYKTGSGFSVSEKTDTKAIFSSKGKKYNLNANFIDKENLVFEGNNSSLSFAPVIEVTKFLLTSISEGSAFADNGTFEKNLVQIKNALISAVPGAISSNVAISENTAVAYVAEMALKGKYKSAVETIPESVKKSGRRTYFSTPYFGSLSSLESTFIRTLENTEKVIRNSMELKTLDAFVSPDLLNYILINQKRSFVAEFLKFPATLPSFEPTLSQAQSIIELYNGLKSRNVELAESLKIVLGKCIEKVEECCSFDETSGNTGKLILSENGAPVSQTQTVAIGMAIFNYAKLSGKNDLIPGGRLIVSSALTEKIPSDLYNLTELYSVDGIGKGGKYYPRLAVIENGTSMVWAWTVAESIRYNYASDTKIGTISIKFPVGDSHYLYVGGIPGFNAIDIYNVGFRTDPRFESYNSSGYVYSGKTKTLMLKSRHRETTETVKLYFAERPAPKTVPKTAPKAETKPTEAKPAAVPSAEVKKETKEQPVAPAPKASVESAASESDSE